MCTLLPAAAAAAPPFFDRDQMILQSASLVRRAVGRYMVRRPGLLDPEDMVSFGTLGLIDAVDRYDHARGVKFETYAVTRIRGYVVDQLRSLDWLPRSARTNVRLVQNAAAELEESLGRRPAAKELEARTGLAGAACSQALADSACRVVSLEAIAPDSDDLSTTMVRHLEDESCPNPALAMEEQEVRQSVMQALEALPDRERAVVRLKHIDEWTYREIAVHLGVSESRVSQLHTQGLNRMRRRLLAEVEEPDNQRLSA